LIFVRSRRLPRCTLYRPTVQSGQSITIRKHIFSVGIQTVNEPKVTCGGLVPFWFAD
jgi:hypothetical protein